MSALETTGLFLIGTHVIVVVLLSVITYRSVQGRKRYSAAIILPLWLAVAAFLALQGLTGGLDSLFSPLAIGMTIPIVVGLFALWRVPALRDIVHALPQRWLIGVQAYRVFGFIFLMVGASGSLPPLLFITPAIIDLTIGISAPFVALWVTTANGQRLALAWNILGIADFAISITLSLLASPVLGVLSLTPGPEAIAEMPLSFVVMWAVPLSILLHAFSLMKLFTERSNADRKTVGVVSQHTARASFAGTIETE